jgi:hypothetical protein
MFVGFQIYISEQQDIKITTYFEIQGRLHYIFTTTTIIIIITYLHINYQISLKHFKRFYYKLKCVAGSED